MFGLFDLNCEEVFFNSVSHTLADTGPPYILYKILIELTLVCHFSQRIVSIWNSLPNNVDFCLNKWIWIWNFVHFPLLRELLAL